MTTKKAASRAASKPANLKLVPGKLYRTRSGKKALLVGKERGGGFHSYPYLALVGWNERNGTYWSWETLTAHGLSFAGGESDNDLIAEWAPTKKPAARKPAKKPAARKPAKIAAKKPALTRVIL